MIDTTSQSVAESRPHITEKEIVRAIQSKTTPHPAAKSYGSLPAEWIEDIEAIDLMTEMRDKYEAVLAALRQENAQLVDQLQRGSPHT